jgi:hypothetical protein
MAYFIPTFRTLGDMKAKDIPSYLAANTSLKNICYFSSDVKTWYWEKYIQRNSGAFLFHVMAFCSLFQLAVTVPYHTQSMSIFLDRLNS